jgi:hypothetical protein
MCIHGVIILLQEFAIGNEEVTKLLSVGPNTIPKIEPGICPIVTPCSEIRKRKDFKDWAL